MREANQSTLGAANFLVAPFSFWCSHLRAALTDVKTSCMEHIVAVKVVDAVGKSHYFVTWGRIFGAADPEPLLKTMTQHLSQFGIKSFDTINLCRSLREACDEPYFYEALFSFSQKKIPFGENYEKWRKEQQEKIQDGKEIYYLGTD